MTEDKERDKRLQMNALNMYDLLLALLTIIRLQQSHLGRKEPNNYGADEVKIFKGLQLFECLAANKVQELLACIDGEEAEK